MALRDPLFSKISWYEVVDLQLKSLRAEVAQYDENRMLNTSVDALSEYFAAKFRVDVPILQKEKIVADQRETPVDVSHRFDYISDHRGSHHVLGTTVEITIPFTGELQAFHIRPSSFSMNPPCASINSDGLLIQITGIQLDQAEVKSEIESTIKNIEDNLTTLRNDLSTLNATLLKEAVSQIETRRAKLLSNRNLVSSLGFAIKKNPNSMTYTAPNVRRKIVPPPPPASSAPYQPEPSLSNQDYDHILDVIQNMAHVMERSPAAFATMGEESLRTHFLVQLNGHYEGQATGETFNFEGKTDILIRSDGKNIFIGECKFWNGPKVLNETIDQLLGYSSWRDTKVAVLVFNRNKDLSKVLESVKVTTSSHPNCRRFVSAISETAFRYVFSHKSDPNREMTLTVMVFDVPTA